MTTEIPHINFKEIEDEYNDLRFYARNVTDLEQSRNRQISRRYSVMRTVLGEDCPDQTVSGSINSVYKSTPFWDAFFSCDIEDRALEPVCLTWEAEKATRKSMVKALKKILKKNPHMKEFIDTTGLGSSNPMLMSRLLGEIGHPVATIPKTYIENPKFVEKGQGVKKRIPVEGEPFLRSVRQLWAYTGMGDPARRRKKKMSEEEARQCGRPASKSFIFLIAEACIKFEGATEKAPNRPRSPYRDVYDQGKMKYQREHQTGAEDDWSDGHCHMAALRLTCKAILKDMHSAALKDLEAAT